MSIFNVLRHFSSANVPSIKQVLSQHNLRDNLEIRGWIKSIRRMKETTFLDISDGSTDQKLQVVLNKHALSDSLAAGSSVVINGTLNTTHKGQQELIASNISVTGGCNLDDGYPFAPRKTYAQDYIRQFLHLRSRTNKFGSLLRIRDAAMQATHSYLHKNGYINIHTPIITSNDCEGAGEVFTIQPECKKILKDMAQKGTPLEEAYFNTKAFLTVSGQLHLEAMAHGLSRVYTFGPTFRAENSRSRLHLSEFYMLEVEIAFINTIEDLIPNIEQLIQNVTKEIVNNCIADIKQAQVGEIDYSWMDKNFPIITVEEAINILSQNSRPTSLEKGFSKDDEMFLVKYCGNIPTFVINWPKEQKPFYMKQCSNDSSKVAALDLLAPNVGEIVGGSLREDKYDILKAKLPSEQLQWYLDLRKFGGVPTGGFGLGFERYLQLLLGIVNIKDTIPFPRWPHNCSL